MEVEVKTVTTSPHEGQKPGTSGLRKKTKIFQQETNYVENFVQATFNALKEKSKGEKQKSKKEEKEKEDTLVIGGDGRYFNEEMVQTIVKISAANGVKRCWIGKDGLLSTPAVSAIIRQRENGIASGGFILTASHNPGGPEEDCGIKYNVANGGPAPESVTNAIFEQTKTITEYFTCPDIPPIDLSKIGKHEFQLQADSKASGTTHKFVVEVIDPTEDYVKLLKSVFDFPMMQKLVQRSDFSFVYDAMHGVAGPYAKAIFRDALGISESSLLNCDPKSDFGGLHPDPNLTYAEQLVKTMGLDRKGTPQTTSDDSKIPVLGAAADGDADRNMILGKKFFVTPSDSLAIIAANAQACIPYFRDGGLRGLARSMPTSAAVDLVAKKLNVPFFEVPTGWKFFGNLMDSGSLGQKEYSPLICGEESFGTGSSHVREKDGIWAVLCWLSLLAFKNLETPIGSLVSVEDIVRNHWNTYGRNYYQRFDYEGVESKQANDMMAALSKLIEEYKGKKPELAPGFKLDTCDEFSFTDPVDGGISKNQGWRFLFEDGSRFVFRLSGTGSAGATIRLYLEKYTPPEGDLTVVTSEALNTLVKMALDTSKLEAFTGRKEPTVIT